MELRPLHDRVIVKRLEPETKTASGIVLAEVALEQQDQGSIVAVGVGRTDDNGRLQPLSVKVGDLVLFGKFAGAMFKHEGEEFLTMREEDIIGVLV